jgi:NADH-quinone oxidoreductase subunit M
MIVLLGFIILIGVYPSILNETIDFTVQSLLARIGG